MSGDIGSRCGAAASLSARARWFRDNHTIAIKTLSGKIVVGKPSDIHSDIIERYRANHIEDLPVGCGVNDYCGWVNNKTGEWVSRDEAERLCGFREAISLGGAAEGVSWMEYSDNISRRKTNPGLEQKRWLVEYIEELGTVYHIEEGRGPSKEVIEQICFERGLRLFPGIFGYVRVTEIPAKDNPAPETITLYRGGYFAINDDFTATEGIGYYLSPDPAFVYQFGPVVSSAKVNLPNNVLLVDEEPLYLLWEFTDSLTGEKIKFEDTPWGNINRLAYNATVEKYPEYITNSPTEAITYNSKKITEFARLAGYKGFHFISGVDDQWYVLFDELEYRR
jgi:hypothetical protein